MNTSLCSETFTELSLAIKSDVICKLPSSAFLYNRKQAYHSSWAENRKNWQTMWENWLLKWSWRVRRRLKLKIYWEYRNLQSDQFGQSIWIRGRSTKQREADVLPRCHSGIGTGSFVKQKWTDLGHVLNDITDDFNRSRKENDHVHPRTVQRFLHKQDVKRRVVRKKMVVSQINRKKTCFVVSWEKKTHC